MHWLYPGNVAYTSEEVQYSRFIHKLDVYGVILAVPVYVAMGKFCQWTNYPNPNPWLGMPQDQASGVFCLVLSCFVLYQHIFSRPTPTRDEPSVNWGVQQIFGRWVYLTRHVLTLQTWHFVFSFAWPEMANTMATIIAGFSFYVTAQYFALVHFHPRFILLCKYWAGKECPLREVTVWLHIPCTLMGVFDVLYVKERQSVLTSSGGGPANMTVVCVYTAFYAAMLYYNHTRTGFWPYHVLDTIGDWKRWAGFGVLQLCICGLLVGIAYCMEYIYQVYR